ncbi:MAG: CrcB family protein [Firmicutes bacterium]|nr:CrcB family protein [Bacillota bacterium]MBQ2058858.1 CrcB family protein [Bacillota bacterium]MBQ4371076.1 CrcB family protein [Bacillota bacterium]
MLTNCLTVAAGGAIGAVLRYLITLIPVSPASGFPIKTYFINFTGALAAGIALALISKHPDIDPVLYNFVRVGIVGGYTTFATCFTESYVFMKNGNPAFGIAYAVFSVLSAYAGIYAADMLVK